MTHQYKIALVKSGVYTDGGVSSVCQFLYQLLSSDKRFDVQLISLETDYNNPSNLRILSPKSWFQKNRITDYTWNGIPVKHIGAIFSELEFLRYMSRNEITNLLDQYDLVQVVAGCPAIANVVSSISKPICLQMATLASLERKYVLQKANLFKKVYGNLMLPFVSRVEQQALKRVDHIFADTEYTKQAILPYTDASKISIDTIGVNIQKFRPCSEEQRSDDYILSVGRLGDPRKNIALLFDAYALLRQRLPDTPKLILAGKTTPSQADWAKARDLGISKHVEVITGPSLDKLIELYQNAAFYVLSSSEEGLGIVLLEALACATPVISTRCGVPNSIVSNEIGFLIPVGDTKALVDRMFWMLQNPKQRRMMGKAGRKMVESRFANEVVGKKYFDVYDKLLKENLI